MPKFSYQLDNEMKIRGIELETGIYSLAAMAIPATFKEVNFPLLVKIWVKELLPKYGPYFYQINYDAYMNLTVKHIIPKNG